MHKAISVGLLMTVNFFTKRKCFTKFFQEKIFVRLFVSAAKKPDRNEGVGIIEASSKEFFVVGKELYGFTGSDIAGKACEFIAENPEMTFLDPVVFFWLKVERLHCLEKCVVVLIALHFTVT